MLIFGGVVFQASIFQGTFVSFLREKLLGLGNLKAQKLATQIQLILDPHFRSRNLGILIMAISLGRNSSPINLKQPGCFRVFLGSPNPLPSLSKAWKATWPSWHFCSKIRFGPGISIQGVLHRRNHKKLWFPKGISYSRVPFSGEPCETLGGYNVWNST